jgi:purine nucleosidase
MEQQGLQEHNNRTGRIPVILDTDIGSDVDDALALALMARHPGFDLRGVTTVSGDTVRRARIARKLLHLAGRDDVEVAVGERGEQTHVYRSAEGGHEDEMLGEWTGDLALSERGGVDLLVDELRGGQVELTTVGMQSNLAAALDEAPELVTAIPRVTVMGGLFAQPRTLGKALPASIDHNLNVDQRASLRSLNAGMRTVYVPCDVTMDLWLMRPHVDRLRAGDELCREIARQIDVYRREEGAPEGYMCRLHDPLAVATIVERSFVTTTRAKVTVAPVGDHLRTFIDELEGREAEIVTSVDGQVFADWWLEWVLG